MQIKLKNGIKPAIVSGVGLIMVALAGMKLFYVSPIYMLVGWGLVLTGTLYYLGTQVEWR